MGFIKRHFKLACGLVFGGSSIAWEYKWEAVRAPRLAAQRLRPWSLLACILRRRPSTDGIQYEASARVNPMGGIYA
jgi:hypothetical protein